MKRGLTGRMIVAGGLLVLLVAATFAVLLYTVLGMRDSQLEARDSRSELTAVGQLEKLLVDMETGLRGFVITREDRFLGPWRAGRRAFPRQAADLARNADDPAEVEEFAAIAEAGDSYIEGYGVPLIGLVRAENPRASSVAVTLEGKRHVDALRSRFLDLTLRERRLLDAQTEKADVDTQRALLAASLGLALSVLLILLFIGYLARTVVRPVTRASALAGRLAAGDLGTRMAETGVGEIGALERAFNRMADSLERSRDELAALASEQAALRRVATLVARRASPGEIFETVTREVGLLFGADLARLERYEEDGTVTGVAGWSKAEAGDLAVGTRIVLEGVSIAALVRESGRPARIDSFEDAAGPIADEARSVGIRSSVGCPIVVGGKPWGVIAASSTDEAAFPPDAELRIGEFTALVATAIANAEAQAELAASRARVVASADETRRQIERDLHDGAQQRLVSLALQLRAAQAAVPPDLDELVTELGEIAAALIAALDELREYARGIHPAILAEGGLGPALKTLAPRSAIPVELDVRTEGRLPEPIEVGAYYIVSEALTNAVKHAQASRVGVDAGVHDGALHILVRDDGVGGADFARGSGLLGLKDRVEALGGRITLESEPGAGTSLSVELPVASSG